MSEHVSSHISRTISRSTFFRFGRLLEQTATRCKRFIYALQNYVYLHGRKIRSRSTTLINSQYIIIYIYYLNSGLKNEAHLHVFDIVRRYEYVVHVGSPQGRTFGSMIKEFVSSYEPLQNELLPLYARPEGREIYEESLTATEKYFPQYVTELKGTADGSGVPFHEVSACR